ncbi:DUF5050 domain-containing protein [Clostridium pasteurianum]|uniref:DUF5050 domain-containing protein n=1 Tax=Clostridium pasteurianum TaxID=1501 RepID=UPI00059FF2E7|nr:DUF5050 domain-containing protein [Clostridium pasteurianum]
MKKVFLIMCVSVLLLISFGCSYNKSTSNMAGEAKESISGPIVQNGNWLYESGKLSKINTNGTNKSYIGHAYGSIIDVVDNWIYYVDGTMGQIGSNGIYKIKDNRVIKLTSDDYILEAVFYKGSIYYALGSEMGENNIVKGGLYKIDSNGKNKVQISDQLVSNINISGNWIYYSGVSSVTKGNIISGENSGIFKINTDGTHKTKIYNKTAKFLKVSGDNIYFSNSDDECKLYKINTDGTNEKKLNDDNSWDIVVSGNWIYYADNPYDGHTLMRLPLDQTRGDIYKITIDGNERTKLNSEASRLTEVLDGWIYYSSWSDRELYKMKLDGSSKLLVK